MQRLKAAQRGQRKLSTGKVEFTKDFLEEDLSEEDQSDFSENESVDSSEEKDESMNFQQSSFSSDGESVSEAEFD